MKSSKSKKKKNNRNGATGDTILELKRGYKITMKVNFKQIIRRGILIENQKLYKEVGGYSRAKKLQ